MTCKMTTCSAMMHPKPIDGMNTIKSIALILSGLCIAWTSCYSQSIVDEELTTLFDSRDTVRQDYGSPLREAENDISVIVSVAFLFYKEFISSQDNPSCVFTPSCSEYAVEAVQEHGLIVGLLKTFDRLSRCHGLVNPRHYPFDTEKKRYYDPVR